MRIISGKRRGKKLKAPANMDTRPTLDRVKESIFNIIAGEIEDIVVLDLFSGSGNIGIEFISRGAKLAYFIDSDIDSIKLIKYNLNDSGLAENSKVIKIDAMKFLKNTKEKFDIVYIDPPYGKDYLYEKTLKILAQRDLLNKNAKIIVESKKALDIKNSKLFETIDERIYGDTKILFLKERVDESNLPGQL